MENNMDVRKFEMIIDGLLTIRRHADTVIEVSVKSDKIDLDNGSMTLVEALRDIREILDLEETYISEFLQKIEKKKQDEGV